MYESETEVKYFGPELNEHLFSVKKLFYLICKKFFINFLYYAC